MTRQMFTSFLRPNMSARAPKEIDPIAIPMSPALSKIPSCEGVSAHSEDTEAAANDITSTSNPSSMLISVQIKTVWI